MVFILVLLFIVWLGFEYTVINHLVFSLPIPVSLYFVKHLFLRLRHC